jgi:hypothetical protein
MLLRKWADHCSCGRPDQGADVAKKLCVNWCVRFKNHVDRFKVAPTAAGDPLMEVQHEAENGLQFAQKARFGWYVVEEP